MKTPTERQNGIIAVLDALGAASYGDAEVRRFMRSRDLVLQALNEKAEELYGNVDPEAVTTFTFNDTVLIVLKSSDGPSLNDAGPFFSMLRKFIADSFVNNILFRGSVSIGSFYVNNQTNTVMGQAVTDAAAWYEQADWIGVHTTPRASLIIEGWLEGAKSRREHLLVDWEIPLHGGRTIQAKAVNWPRIFSVPKMSPCAKGEPPRKKLLEMLSSHSVPIGVEAKFANTLSFFDEDLKRYEKIRPTSQPRRRERARGR